MNNPNKNITQATHRINQICYYFNHIQYSKNSHNKQTIIFLFIETTEYNTLLSDLKTF